MPATKHLWIIISTLVWLSVLPANLSGQAFRFRNFGPESKIPDTYVYCINQDLNGFLWVGTGNGIAKFDGFDFHLVSFPDSSSGRYVSVSFRDRNGRIWLGCSDGSVFYNSSDGLIKIPDQGVQSVNSIFDDKEGNIWVIPQDKMILKINSENPDDISKFYVSRSLIMTSGCFTSAGDILLGTPENLLLCSIGKDSVVTKTIVEGIEYTKIQAIKKLGNKDIWLIGTEGNGLYKLTFDNGKPAVGRFAGHPELESLDIKTIIEDNSGNIWMSAYNSGIYRISISDKDGSITAIRSFTSRIGSDGRKYQIHFPGYGR